MDLRSNKRIVAFAVAGAAAAVPASAFAQSVTGNRFDYSAPVVASEDITAFKKLEGLKEDKRRAGFQKDSEACYMSSGNAPVVQGGAPAGGAKAADSRRSSKYAGRNLQQLSELGAEVEKMPERTEAERLAKLQEQQELQDALRAVITQMAGNAPRPATLSPTFPVPGGIFGSAMAQATNRQMQAATNPAIASCLADVDAKYQDQSTPLQIVYEDGQFEDAERLLSKGARTAHVILTDGSRYNVVKKSGAYGAKAVSLEDAMKMAAMSRSTAPEYDDKGQAGAKLAVAPVMTATQGTAPQALPQSSFQGVDLENDASFKQQNPSAYAAYLEMSGLIVVKPDPAIRKMPSRKELNEMSHTEREKLENARDMAIAKEQKAIEQAKKDFTALYIGGNTPPNLQGKRKDFETAIGKINGLSAPAQAEVLGRLVRDIKETNDNGRQPDTLLIVRTLFNIFPQAVDIQVTYRERPKMGHLNTQSEAPDFDAAPKIKTSPVRDYLKAHSVIASREANDQYANAYGHRAVEVDRIFYTK